MTSQHLTCNCGSDTFHITATVTIPLHVGPSGTSIQIEGIVGSVTNVGGRCFLCGRTSDGGVPSALDAARAKAITHLATAAITQPRRRRA